MRYLTPYTLAGKSGPSGGSGISPNTDRYARVTSVILSDPDIKKVNSIIYAPIENLTTASEEADKGHRIAYPVSSDFFTVPIIGEVVKIISIPSPNMIELKTAEEKYYERIVNYWNTPKDGLYFDTRKEIEPSELHNKINVNPIKTAIGDTLIQGRYGQAIRFTQEQDSGMPRIFLGTGRPFEAPATSQVELDLDKAQSGIEFTTDGISKLKTLKKFEKSHRSSEKPKTSDTYKGEQILVNTGRVVLNSKNDSTLISAKETVSLSANTLNQEADKEICFEAPKIYLGSEALTSPNPEPVLLGNQVESYLLSIMDELIGVMDSLSTAATAAGEPLPLLNKKGREVSIVLRSLRNKLNPKGTSPLKSKKSFTQ